MNERIKELAEQSGIDLDNYCEVDDVVIYDVLLNQLESFAELIRSDENEACWKLCKKLWDSEGAYANDCADAIRARGDK